MFVPPFALNPSTNLYNDSFEESNGFSPKILLSKEIIDNFSLSFWSSINLLMEFFNESILSAILPDTSQASIILILS